jgi:hypothetical protein
MNRAVITIEAGLPRLIFSPKKYKKKEKNRERERERERERRLTESQLQLVLIIYHDGVQDFFPEFGSILLVPTGPVLVFSILHVFRFSRSLSLGLSLEFIIIFFTS